MEHGYTFVLLAAIAASPSLQAQYAVGALDVNNVYAEFRSNGLISENTALGSPNYFVPRTPANTGPSPLFAGGLWIGGLSPDSILHFAGERFEQLGLDFFPGPLGTNGSISQQTSVQYDVVQKVDRTDVERQIGYFNCLADPDCDAEAEYAGFTVPASFYQWPAHGDLNLGQDYNLADFYDFDHDGNYNPDSGDAPCFPGDQALFTIYNDNLAPHTESGGLPIGVEVQMTPFAYSSNEPAVNQSVFVRYKIINRGSQTLYKTYIGLFDDFDLGCPNDDYIQCDVGRNLFFVLNGDDVDEDCMGHQGYGNPSPAFGVVILKGPLMDADGTDNTDINTLPGYNGTGFNDGNTDNERLGMGHFGFFANSGGPTGDPDQAIEYYRYMRGEWADGTPQTYGGSGYNPGTDSIPARFAYPGDSDPLGIGTGGIPKPAWTQASAGFVPTDQRGFASMGPFTLEPGDEQEIVVAYVYARPITSGANARVEALNLRTDTLRAFAQTIPGLLGDGFDCSQLPTAIAANAAKERGLRLFPNPATGLLNLVVPSIGTQGRITVLNAQGSIVQEQKTTGTSTVLDVARLAAGVYMVRVLEDGKAQMRTFVKE